MKKLSFDLNNDSIATILRRKKLSDNLYQFTYDNVLIGHYDVNRDVFISSYGKEYPSIRSSKFLKSENNQVFNLCLNSEDLNTVFSIDHDIHLKFLISKYIEYVKNLMYFVKVNKKSNGKNSVHIKDVDLNRLEDSFINSNKNGEEDSFIEEFSTSDIHSNDFLDSYYSDNASITNDLENLIVNIYNCEYNSNQLFTIAENVLFLKDYLEKTLDSIELQLHAYHDCDKEPLHPDISDFEFINTDYDPYSDFVRKSDNINDIYISKKESKAIKRKLDIIKLRDQIKQYLINQDEALRRILAEIARMYVKDSENNEGILLMGDTGTGKTYLMELLSKFLEVPFLHIDSTQITIPGYIGKDIEEYLWDLYESCDGDLEKAETAIVYFDEIDKKGSNRKSDVSGQGVLNVLLKFLDGTTYDACRDVKHSNEKVKINTSRMKIIAGGAFKDVFNEDYEKEKRNIGFSIKQEENNSENNDIPDIDVFVQKAFMIPEFMGRFPIKIRLKSHTVDSFSDVLLNSKDSTLKEEVKTFGKFGVKLSFTPDFIKAASTEALRLKTGVRGLMGTIENATWVAFEDIYVNSDKYSEIILTEETLEDPNNYQKVLKKEV